MSDACLGVDLPCKRDLLGKEVTLLRVEGQSVFHKDATLTFKITEQGYNVIEDVVHNLSVATLNGRQFELHILGVQFAKADAKKSHPFMPHDVQQ